MKVWIESSFDNLPSEGFRKQRFWLMAEALVRAGHEVMYWTGDFNHGTKQKRVLKVGEADWEAGIKLRLIPVMPYKSNVCISRILSHRRYAKDLKAAMMKEGEKPDIVIASMPALSSAFAVFKVARQLGAKVVVDVMDAWPETFYRLLPRGLKWMGYFLFAGMRSTAKKIYREADLVTGVCERYRELTKREDYYLAYHGVEVEENRLEVEGWRLNSGGLSSDCEEITRLVYAGNLGNGYDLGTVILEAKKHQDWRVEIAGRGPNEEKWKAMASDNVKFLGYLDEEALKAVLQKADVGIIPMRDDSWVGLPYKLGDYAKANLRIVSSLHGEVEELLKRHKCGSCYTWGIGGSLALAVKTAMKKEGSGVLLKELDAIKIYDEYVKRVVEIK